MALLEEVLGQPAWQGVGAIVAFLAFVATLWTEARRRAARLPGSRRLAMVSVGGVLTAGIIGLLWWRIAPTRPFVATLIAVVGTGTLLFVGVLGRPSARYARRYRLWAQETMRFIRNRRLSTVGPFGLEVEDVYVDVSLVPRPPAEIEGGVLADVAGPASRHSIWEFLGSRGKHVLVIRGLPGGGKSTLLLHVGGRVARTRRLFVQHLPVLVELRDHAQRITEGAAPSLPEFLREALPEIPGGAEPPRWWERRLEQGRCVLMFDGLDEVFDPDDRQRVIRWINGLIPLYPRNSFLVTSRSHGYVGAAIDGAQVLQVRPFTDEQITQFVHAWCRAIKRHEAGTSDQTTRSTAERAAQDLLATLFAVPALHDLAINPLLLTMIVNVHRYRGALPQTRPDLYAEMCRVLLGRRLARSGADVERDTGRKERILARLAWELMHRPLGALPRAEARAIVTRVWRDLPGPAEAEAEAFLAEVGANGLLVQPERHTVAFVHLTFQEYLAARYVRDEGLLGELERYVDDPAWREVTLLAVAGVEADSVVTACLRSGSVAALSLAFECVQVRATVSTGLRRRLDEILTVAFRPTADSRHRRLVAGIQAVRHLSAHVSTSTGSVLCRLPVTSDLYWLFVQDTGRPLPDGPCPPTPEVPTTVTGVWGADARAFVRWVNEVTVGSGASGMFRLPVADELRDLAARGGVASAQISRPGTSIWIEGRDGRPRLWTAEGVASPHEVTGRELRTSIALTVLDPPILPLLLSHTVAVRALVMTAVIIDAGRRVTRLRKMSRGALIALHQHAEARLESELRRLGRATEAYDKGVSVPARATDGDENPREVLADLRESVRMFARALRRADDEGFDFESALRRWRTGEIPETGRPTVADFEHPAEIELAEIRCAGRAVAEAQVQAYALMKLLRQLGVGRDGVLGDYDGALTFGEEVQRLHTEVANLHGRLDPGLHRDPPSPLGARERAEERRKALKEAEDTARRFGVGASRLQQSLRGVEVRRVPGLVYPTPLPEPEDLGVVNAPLVAIQQLLRRSVGDALAEATLVVLQARHQRDRESSFDAFARTLLVAADVGDGDRLEVRLDELVAAARQICRVDGGNTASWWSENVKRLAELTVPAFRRASPISAEAAASARVLALALAVAARRQRRYEVADRFCLLGAGVTLLLRRARDSSRAAEILLLARL